MVVKEFSEGGWTRKLNTVKRKLKKLEELNAPAAILDFYKDKVRRMEEGRYSYTDERPGHYGEEVVWKVKDMTRGEYRHLVEGSDKTGVSSQAV